jgi:hypothetical protein
MSMSHWQEPWPRRAPARKVQCTHGLAGAKAFAVKNMINNTHVFLMFHANKIERLFMRSLENDGQLFLKPIQCFGQPADAK